jgi:O-antigen/teichoic acid export membrane protein
VAGAVVTVVALRIATHYFGPQEWGLIVAAMALAGLFIGVCDLGISTIASRELARPDEQRGAVYGAAIVGIALVSLPLMAVAAGVDYAVYVSHREVRDLVLIQLPLIPLNGLWLAGGAVLISRARNDLRGVIDVVTSCLLLAATVITVKAGLGAGGYVWLTLAWTAVGTALAIGFARLYGRADFKGAASYLLATFRQAAPLGASQVFNTLNTQIDTILLALFASAPIVGAFGLASQVATFGTAVPPMLTAAILPKFVAADDLKRRQTLQRSFDVLAVAAAAIPLFAVLFSRGVVIAIGGSKFHQAVLSMALLSCWAALAFPVRLFLDGLVYVGAERKLIAISGSVTIVNLVAAFVAIPLWHAVGAAAAMILSALIYLVGGWIAFHRSAGYSVDAGLGAKSVVVAASLLAAYWLVHATTTFRPGTGLILIPEALAVGVAYAAGVILWGGPAARALGPRRWAAGAGPPLER